MVRTSSKLVSLAVVVLVALPAAAGDFAGRSFQRHHGLGGIGSPVFGHHHGLGGIGSPVFGHHHGLGDIGSSVFGHHHGLGNRPPRFAGRAFAGGYDGFARRHERNRLLQRFYSPSTSYPGNNVVIVVQPSQGGGSGSVYSGSTLANEAGGGTYVGGGGYSFDPTGQLPNLAPMAKVIDVAAKGNSCSYEAGVCVIRP